MSEGIGALSAEWFRPFNSKRYRRIVKDGYMVATSSGIILGVLLIILKKTHNGTRYTLKTVS
jgi:hypothetical protein